MTDLKKEERDLWCAVMAASIGALSGNLDVCKIDIPAVGADADAAVTEFRKRYGKNNLRKDDGPAAELAQVVTADAALLKRLCAILSEHVGETGESEGAVDVLNRLLREHKCPINRKTPEEKA